MTLEIQTPGWLGFLLGLHQGKKNNQPRSSGLVTGVLSSHTSQHLPSFLQQVLASLQVKTLCSELIKRDSSQNSKGFGTLFGTRHSGGGQEIEHVARFKMCNSSENKRQKPNTPKIHGERWLWARAVSRGRLWLSGLLAVRSLRG